jgi:hypothetical protein
MVGDQWLLSAADEERQLFGTHLVRSGATDDVTVSARFDRPFQAMLPFDADVTDDGLVVTRLYEGHGAEGQVAPGEIVVAVQGEPVGPWTRGNVGARFLAMLAYSKPELALRIRSADGLEREVTLSR